jgi:AcrR family transcriptional regulator
MTGGPADARALAREKFLAGERLDMRGLAAELGVGRATLYRWVGDKELLLGEVMGELTRATMAANRRVVPGHGPAHVAEVIRRGVEQTHAFGPLRAFIERDPEYALRVLTSGKSNAQRATITAVRELLADEVAAGHLAPAADLDDLAYVIVRIGESFIYADLIIGREPDLAKAGVMVRMLLGEPG